MKPSQKSPEMERLLESLMGRTTAIQNNVCTMCGSPAIEFKDELSRKEYTISGMCQICQDKAFTEPEEEEGEY